MKLALRTRILVGVAAAIAAYVVFGPSDNAPTAEAAPASARDHTPHAATPSAGKAHGGSATEALALFAHRVADATAAAALFAPHSWYVPPPPPPPPPPVAAGPPPKPTAPPLPYQFMGTFSSAGEAPTVFLTHGDVVFSVHVGDTLENTYSVDKLEGGQLYLTYKPLNIQQQLSVSAGGSP